jgi:hypothetical protein
MPHRLGWRLRSGGMTPMSSRRMSNRSGSADGPTPASCGATDLTGGSALTNHGVLAEAFHNTSGGRRCHEGESRLLTCMSASRHCGAGIGCRSGPRERERLDWRTGEFERPSPHGGCPLKPVIGMAIFRSIVLLQLAESGCTRPAAVRLAHANGRFRTRRSKAGGPASDPKAS